MDPNWKDNRTDRQTDRRTALFRNTPPNREIYIIVLTVNHNNADISCEIFALTVRQLSVDSANVFINNSRR